MGAPEPTIPPQTRCQGEKNHPRTSATPPPRTGSPAHLPSWQRVKGHLTASVRPSIFAEFELVLLTFCTGLQDAISFPDYHCFASNQTGNTVFLALALILPQLNGDMFYTANIGAALGFFLLGGWATGQLSHKCGPRKRYWLVLCNFLQSCMVFTVAAIQYVHGAEHEGGRAVVAISLLAFASGSQVVQSRSLKMTEISTAMATAAWVDLLIDKELLQRTNRPRNRRAAFLTSLVLGSLLGAYIYKTAGSATAIAVSAAGKTLVTVMYLFNGAENRKTISDDESV